MWFYFISCIRLTCQKKIRCTTCRKESLFYAIAMFFISYRRSQCDMSDAECWMSKLQLVSKKNIQSITCFTTAPFSSLSFSFYPVRKITTTIKVTRIRRLRMNFQTLKMCFCLFDMPSHFQMRAGEEKCSSCDTLETPHAARCELW